MTEIVIPADGSFTASDAATAVGWLRAHSVQSILHLLSTRRTPLGTRLTARQTERLCAAFCAAMSAGVPVQVHRD